MTDKKNLAVYDVYYDKRRKSAMARTKHDHVINIEIDINHLKKFANDVDIKQPKELQKVAKEFISAVNIDS